MMYRFLVSFSIFHEIAEDFGPASPGALLTSFYDCSDLPGNRRASADVLGRSPRPLELPATLPATGADPERIPRVGPVLVPAPAPPRSGSHGGAGPGPAPPVE